VQPARPYHPLVCTVCLQAASLSLSHTPTVWVAATCRQYLTQTEVWSGLVVEVTQRLEEKLTFTQRSHMRQWFGSRALDWVQLWCKPMRMCLAFSYNWRTRRGDLIMRCFLPLLVALVLVGVGMGVGIWELTKQSKGPPRSQTPAKAGSKDSLWSEQPVRRGRPVS